MNSVWYDLNGKPIELSDSYIYEVNLGKYWKNGYSTLGTKYYTAINPLHFKKTCSIEKFDDYQIIKEITLIGVPMEYIKRKKLKVYDPNKKRKKKCPGKR